MKCDIDLQFKQQVHSVTGLRIECMHEPCTSQMIIETIPLYLVNCVLDPSMW